MHKQNNRVKLVVSNQRQEKKRRQRRGKRGTPSNTIKCSHKNKNIIKKYRTNYPFGKKSKGKIYGKPIKKKIICKNCSKVLYKGK